MVVGIDPAQLQVCHARDDLFGERLGVRRELRNIPIIDRKRGREMAKPELQAGETGVGGRQTG